MLTNAMNSAASGLRVAQERMALLSRNIANASTEGYNKKLQQQSTIFGGGAKTDAIVRSVDETVTRDLRRNAALIEFDKTQITALEHLDGLNGPPSEPMSLASQLWELGNRLQSSATDPSNITRLSAVMDQAQTVVDTTHGLADALHDLRSRTGTDLQAAVGEAQDLIDEIVVLNNKVADVLNIKGDATDLQDQRDRLTKELSEIIEIRTVPDLSGKFYLYSADWQLLGFSQAATLTVTASWDIQADGQTVAINGGKTGGMRTLLTSAIPERLQQLDNITHNLVEQFETVYGAGTGLFNYTAPAPAIPPAQDGEFADKLRVNPAFVADHRELRGGAAVPAGDATTLNAARDVFLNNTINFAAAPPANPHTLSSLPASTSLVGAVSEMIAYHGQEVENLKRDLERVEAQNIYLEAVRDRVSSVSIDEEMAQMILFQNSYAAAARVMQATRSMFDDLVRIGG